MEEFHKSQAIILSYELQSQESSAKTGKESFSWSFPKPYSKPIAIFLQFLRW